MSGLPEFQEARRTRIPPERNLKRVSCKDMGAMDCSFVAQGNSVQEVKDTMWAHAAKAHPDVLKGMSPEQQAQAAARLEHLLA